MTYMQKYRAWLNDPAVSEGLKAELTAIESDEKEIEDRFYTELQFGTAGLRGVLGAGTNRMNELIVGRATQGLADYLLRQSGRLESIIFVSIDMYTANVYALMPRRHPLFFGAKKGGKNALNDPEVNIPGVEDTSAAHAPAEAFSSHWGNCANAQFQGVSLVN